MAGICAPCLGAKQEPSVYDFIIVGGGFSGAYTAYKLRGLNKKLTVCICESSHRVGGRLLSDDNDADNTKNKDELGGMRIFPSKQEEVARLVKECGCSLTKVGLSDGANLFYANGEAVKKMDVVLDPETGRTPQDLEDHVQKEFSKEFNNQDPLMVEGIRDLGLRDLMLKYGATEKEIERYITYTGYDIFTDDEVASSLFVREGALYNSTMSDDQRYVKEGYEIVAKKLAKKSKATIKYNCKVFGSQRVDDLHKVDTSTGDFFARNVVYALPLPALQEIVKENPNSIPPERVKLFDSIKNIPLFKAFIEWDRTPGKKQWWEEMNHWEGKSTTDNIVRQVHYYDHEDILIYNSGKYAEELNAKFEKDSSAATKEIVAFLKEMHNNDQIPDADVDSTIFKFWPDGSHKWKVGVDIYPTMKKVLYGGDDPEDNSVYICGDAFSIHQGWVMGCVQTVDACVKILANRGKLVHKD